MRRLHLWVVLAVALGIWLWARARLPWLLTTGDEREYADIARQLVRGEGFTTRIVYPALLSYGIAPAHPSLVRPPLWPLAIAGVFRVAGPGDAAVLAAVLPFYLGTVAAACALATTLAGPLAGTVAGLAVATSPHVLLYASLGGTEMAFACWVTLAFVLLARRSHPALVGAACGLAYLTRYNSFVLPGALVALALRPGRVRAVVACLLGCGVVVAPWLARNLAVTGDPFFTLLSLNLWFNPNVTRASATLFHMLEPDLRSTAAMDPWTKARHQLPWLVRHWPFASANPTACVGVALACVRRDVVSVAFALTAVAVTLSTAVVMPLGRYFAPLFPVLLALGAAAWTRWGGRLRVPALALLLAAPLLPAVPAELPDLAAYRKLMAHWGSLPPEEIDPRRRPWPACLAGRPLVLAEDAPLAAWYGDTEAIWLPATETDVRRVLDAYPIEYVWVSERLDVVTPAFLERFEARPECAAHLYRRRRTAAG
jgi:4-amino-4-deoxy-L-arabinose transferase-like glycosyltransferase